MSTHMTLPCGSYGVLTREQATEIVAGHTFMHEQYKAVSFYSCRQLLGDRFDLLLKDQVRNKGPTADAIYPWNVIDYMVPNYPRPGARWVSTQTTLEEKSMADFYVTEERAMAPGIAGDWPPVIPKPDNRHGRLVKVPGLQQRVEGVIEELERMCFLDSIPSHERRVIADLAGVLRSAVLEK